jgi:hypothetical protein
MWIGTGKQHDLKRGELKGIEVFSYLGCRTSWKEGR